MVFTHYEAETPTGPSAPAWYQYGDEESSDVIFLAGREDDNWRLPAHKDFLSHQNPVFQAMFSDNFSQFGRTDSMGRQIIEIPDVDARSCDNLFRFLYGEPVQIRSLETTMGTLHAADKYICPKLGEICINDLLDRINVTNVLAIFKFIRIYSHWTEEDYMDVDCSPEINRDGYEETQRLLHQLNRKCMQIIDDSAAIVLAHEEIEDLDLSCIKLILSRSTLNVKDELQPLSVLQRWADKECKRRQLPLTAENKRELLGEAVYLCRYLTMEANEFEGAGGPALSGILDNDLLSACRKVFQMQNESGESHSKLRRNDSDSINALIERYASFFSSEAKPFLSLLLTPRRPKVIQEPKAKKEKPSTKTRSVCIAIRKWFCQRTITTPIPSPVHVKKSSPYRSPRHGKHVDDVTSVGSPLKTKKRRSGLDATLHHAIVCWAFFFD